MKTKRKSPSKSSSAQPRRVLAPPLATSDALNQMHRRMLQARSFAKSHPRQHSDLWQQEAVTVGVAVELKSGDTLAADATHLFQYIASLSDVNALQSQWLDLVRETKYADLPLRIPADGPNIIPPDSEQKAQIAVAVGAASVLRSLGQANVVAVLGGALGSSFLSANEAISFAVERRLPIVFVFESGLSEGGASQHRALDTLDFGFARIPVDGNDSVAVHRVATEAIQRARQGDGPTLIDCRMAHEENSLGLAFDPIVHMRNYLEKHGLWSEPAKRASMADNDGQHSGNATEERSHASLDEPRSVSQ